jgi:succinyl-CoA synthetase beta subunit
LPRERRRPGHGHDGHHQALIAEGIVAATKELELKVPLVVRLEGTNVEAGKRILAESGLAIQAADNMGDGAQKIVSAIQ